MSQSQRSKAGGAVKKCANPLFEQWISEWREDAVQKNSKMQYVYGKALSSLRKYPLPLSCGRECLILEFFGPSIAKMIDKRMAQENITSQSDSQGSLPFDISQEDPYKKPTKKRQQKKTGNESSQESIDPDAATQQPPKKAKKATAGGKTYIPAHRSGPYALLVALGLKELKPGYRGYMTKTELIQEASSYCDASMSRIANPSTNYTAWNGMAGLITKELVIKRGNPVQYMLTPEGRNLTVKLLQADHGINIIKPNEDEGDTESQTSTVPNAEATHYRTHLNPGQFEVVLYVDTSETTAKCKKEEVIGELRKNGVSLEVVRLSVGDFVWVVREVVHSSENRKRLTISRSAEMIVPFVVERKRSDDLAHSIKDGRFHEQKFRLRQTGLEVIYLIESYGNGDWGLADGALNQAIANTQMTDGFMIQETSSIKDTCAYLTHMTRYLKKIYEYKKISSCTKQEWPSFKDQVSQSEIHLMIFSDFNEFGTKAKNWTVTEMFARHLMRIRGLSVERAYAIIQKYPTLNHLMREYRRCSSEKEKETLLSSIYFGNSGRTIGPSISRTIFKLYNSSNFG